MRWQPLLLAPLLLACGEGHIRAPRVTALAWPPPALLALWPRTAEETARWEDAAAAPLAPGPALSLQLGPRRGTATLVAEESERRLWRTRSGVAIATDGARVVATAGLSEQLLATRFEEPDPLPALSLGYAPAREGWTRRVVDLVGSDGDPTTMRFGLRFECRLSITAETATMRLIEEHCQGAARFTNRFWADPHAGAVIRSEQWIGESLPALVVEMVGPPAAPSSLPGQTSTVHAAPDQEQPQPLQQQRRQHDERLVRW